MPGSTMMSRLLLAAALALSSSSGVVAAATPASAATASDVVATAKGEVGTREGSARADSYGAAVDVHESTRTYAWCAAFVSWVMERTGATGYRSASVGDWVAMAAAGDYGLSVTDTPHPGDLVAFDWDGNGDFAYPNRHIGVVKSVPKNGAFTTIEGNTALPAGGDGVAKRARSTDDGYSTLFIRIDAGSSTARPTVVNSDPARDGTG
jgi:surface antigen